MKQRELYWGCWSWYWGADAVYIEKQILCTSEGYSSLTVSSHTPPLPFILLKLWMTLPFSMPAPRFRGKNEGFNSASKALFVLCSTKASVQSLPALMFKSWWNNVQGFVAFCRSVSVYSEARIGSDEVFVVSYLVVQHNLAVFGINSPTKCTHVFSASLLLLTWQESLSQATRGWTNMVVHGPSVWATAVPLR